MDIASDSDSDSTDQEFLPPLPRRHDHEAGGSAQGAPHAASFPSAPETTPPVPPPAASSSEFSQFLQQMQQQQQMLVQQQQMIIQQQAAQEERQLKYQADIIHQ